MLGDDEFLDNVPRFLRRESRPSRTRPVGAIEESGSARPTSPRPEADRTETPEPQPVTPAPQARPDAPMHREPIRPSSPRANAAESVADKPASGRPALVADNGKRVPPEPATPAPRPKAGGDSPFQVTLPRELIRQIRVRAAEEDTTHRAIILRSLKLYGFSIPDGEDIDRRKAVARRG